MSLPDFITHIIIEDTNRKESIVVRTKAMHTKANTVQDKPFHKRYVNKTNHNNKKKYKHNNLCVASSNMIPCAPNSNPSFKKNGVCFVCGKPRNFAPQCRCRVVANLVEGNDVIVAVISQVNVVTNVNKWVVDSKATRHICANKIMLTSYIAVGNGE